MISTLQTLRDAVIADELDLDWDANVMEAAENYLSGCDGLFNELKKWRVIVKLNSSKVLAFKKLTHYISIL